MSPSRETMLRARQDYIGGEKVAAICARYRVSNARLYLWLDGGPEDENGERLPPIPRRARSAPKRRISDPRAALVARLWRTADRQVREIEARIGRREQEPAERERDARVMAVTVKTLRELVALDDAKSGEAAAKGAARDDDEPPFRDVDELRRELARRVISYANEGLLLPALGTSSPRLSRSLEQLWPLWAHAHQKPPVLTEAGLPWTTWLLVGGRGAGKTRAGAEWVRGMALGRPPFADKPVSPIALVGETEHDVREVMIEGVSGLLRSHRPDERPVWMSSRKRLEWPNGATAHAFSAEDPESLRGPQFSAAWCDEIAKWRHADATFDMLQFGLRLGERPRQVITTTPRPIPLIKRLMKDPATAVTHAVTRANAFHLSPAFLQAVVARYAGTRLGRQELDGEIVEDRPDALWSRALIEACRVEAAPPLSRIVVAVDPPASAGEDAASCGLVAAGRGRTKGFM